MSQQEITTEIAVLPTGASPSDEGVMRQFSLRVVWRSPGRYAVIRNGYECLSAAGTWGYETSPSERRDDWLATHRFTLEDALELAHKVVDQQTLNGGTWAQWQERLAADGAL